jgi:hypothetical protein
MRLRTAGLRGPNAMAGLRGPNAMAGLRGPNAVAAVLLLAAASVPWVVSGAGAAERPVVTNAVQVTANPDPARAYASPQIARHPETGELVIAATETRTLKTVEVFVSSDDGRSWRPGGDPMVKPWTDSSGDPDANVNHTLAVDKNGVVFLAFQANDPRFSALPRMDRPRHIFLARSTDSGRTWQTVKVWDAPEAPEAPRGLKRNNRPWVAVDPKDPQYVYVSWMQWHINDEPPSGNKALIAASRDGGRTFGQPFSLREGDPQGSYEARPAVDGQGWVHTVMAGRGRTDPAPAGQPAPPPPIRTVNYRVSKDHGRTWSPPKQIEEGNAGFSFNRKWGIRADVRNDNLYVFWYGTPDPRATRPNADRDIYMRISRDSGSTWSDRMVVNDDANLPNVQHYDPGMWVAPNGRIDICWFDFRHSPAPEADLPSGNDGGAHDIYYRSSSNGGRSLSNSIKITDRIIDRRYGVWSNNAHIHAPIGIVSTNDTVYFTWQDTRNANPLTSSEDVYFTTLRLKGPVRETVDDDGGAPRWLLAAAGLALGLGVGMCLLAALSRRSRRG